RNSATELSNTVKSMFNISDHVRQNPWMSIACSAASGFVVGRLLANPSAIASSGGQRVSQPRTMLDSMPARSSQPGFWDDIIQMAQREVRAFAETAITTLAVSLKDQLQQKVNSQFAAGNANGNPADSDDEWSKHEHNGAGVR